MKVSKIVLSSIVTLSFVFSAHAEPSRADNRVAEVQSIKPELAKAEVSFKTLKSGETLAAAVISTGEGQEDSSEVEFYFAAKDSNKWTFLDRLQVEESTFDFREDGVIKISIEESGTSSSSTTSLWRLEKDRLKLIGQDSEILNRSALESKTEPCRITESTNFLTGRTVVSLEFAHAKTKKTECKFQKKYFEDQKISELTIGGAKVPVCPDSSKSKTL